MTRGEAVVERAGQVTECDFGRTVKSESPILYMRPQIAKTSSKKEPDGYQTWTEDSEENFACDGAMYLRITGSNLLNG
jgi:hypothetical protein